MEISDYMNNLTLEEKAALCAGSDFWHTAAIKSQGIPAVMMTDGPHGLRKQRSGSDHLGLGKSVPATCFPAAVTSACSFDRTLLALEGAALGAEAKAEGVGMVLGPGLNIKRHPLCGRNFEYFSEDPCVSGELAAAFVDGVQSQGVGACLKHFACNNQETGRLTSDSLVDERALREIYLAGFETAVKKSRPMAVMGAYNKLNGVYACENASLLTGILRGNWGFDGLVMTDWGAMNDVLAAIPAGLDLEMPASGGERTKLLVEAVKTGKVSAEALDRAAENVLRFVLAVNKDEAETEYDDDAHHEISRRIARESAVLLQNDGLLPLSPDTRVTVFNAFGDTLRYQGSGSSRIQPTQLTTPAQALEERGIRFLLCGTDNQDEATNAARAGDAVIVFAGLPDNAESEGIDREGLTLPEEQTAIIELALSVNPHTVVVLLGGGPMSLPWADKAAAILYMGLGGQAVAGAAIDLLFGDDNPSGHLAETWPLRVTDCPANAFFGKKGAVEYRESVFVGYRFYDTAQLPVQYPFGHGLSYTEFEYSALSVDSEAMTVSVTVKNTGTRAGKTVVQLYIVPPAGMLFRPAHELRDFVKLTLAPGQKQTVLFTLSDREFSAWNIRGHDWGIQPGQYTIEIGQSSRDIRLRGTITLIRPLVDWGNLIDNAPAYFKLAQEHALCVPRWQFSYLLGRDSNPAKTEALSLNSTLADAQDVFLGRLILKAALRFLGRDPMTRAMLADMPFRSFLMGGMHLSATKKIVNSLHRAQVRKTLQLKPWQRTPTDDTLAAKGPVLKLTTTKDEAPDEAADKAAEDSAKETADAAADSTSTSAKT